MSLLNYRWLHNSYGYNLNVVYTTFDKFSLKSKWNLWRVRNKILEKKSVFCAIDM